WRSCAARRSSSTRRAVTWWTRRPWWRRSSAGPSPARRSTCTSTSPGCIRRSSAWRTSCSSRTWGVPRWRPGWPWGCAPWRTCARFSPAPRRATGWRDARRVRDRGHRRVPAAHGGPPLRLLPRRAPGPPAGDRARAARPGWRKRRRARRPWRPRRPRRLGRARTAAGPRRPRHPGAGHVVPAPVHRRAERRQSEVERGYEQVRGTFANVVASAAAAGVPAHEVRAVIANLRVRPVITAHPTEAKRVTVLEKHRRIYRRLVDLEAPRWTPR